MGDLCVKIMRLLHIRNAEVKTSRMICCLYSQKVLLVDDITQ